MSNEITISVSGTLSNGNLYRNVPAAAVRINQLTKLRAGHTQILTTTWEEIDVEDVTSGYVFLKNLHATATIEFGPQEGGSGGDGVVNGAIAPNDPTATFHWPVGVVLMARVKPGTGTTATLDSEIWSV